MPYAIVKVKGGFSLINTATGETHTKCSTKKKCMAQLRLLEGIEHGTLVPREKGKGIGASPFIPPSDEQTEMLEMIERRAENAVNMVAKGLYL